MNVLLPQPDGPMKRGDQFLWMSSETFVSAGLPAVGDGESRHVEDGPPRCSGGRQSPIAPGDPLGDVCTASAR